MAVPRYRPTTKPASAETSPTHHASRPLSTRSLLEAYMPVKRYNAAIAAGAAAHTAPP